MQYGSEEQEMGETTAMSHTDRFKPWVSKTWPYSQTLVGLIQRRPWQSFGFGVVHHGLPKVYPRSTETHVTAAGHVALPLVPALAGGDHSKLLLSLPTVLCHLCHHADVFLGLHCRSGVCSSFNPYCSGWSGVQQPPKDRCLSPAEDWSLWYEAETGNGWWRRGLAEQPPQSDGEGVAISGLAGRLQPPATALTSYWVIPKLQISLVPYHASACHLQISDNKI